MSTTPDLWSLYAMMLRSRLFEELVTRLWNDGLVSGEMHLGTGEEGIVAGVVSHLQDDDALALDHRCTPPLLMRGVDPGLILREILGRPDGLCHGMGGHMHLFSKEHLAASSGIVGASGPAAAGFALAARYMRPGSIAVAFFGDGAINQGMLMESLNLASVWNLPVLFVCKDDDWAITTRSSEMTGGGLIERARGFGLETMDTNGADVAHVWETAGKAIDRIRTDGGPVFMRARCIHLEGHFLGYQLLRAASDPLKEVPGMAAPLVRSVTRSGGGSVRARWSGVKSVASTLLTTIRVDRTKADNDPVVNLRSSLSDADRLEVVEDEIGAEMDSLLSAVLAGGES